LTCAGTAGFLPVQDRPWNMEKTKLNGARLIREADLT
jgi:hypothetical protein